MHSAPQTTPASLPPAWTRLAIQSFRYDNWNIYLTHPSGAGEIRLTEMGSNSSPSLARGGEQVVFASNRSGNNDIYLQSANGNGLVALVSGPANENYPVWAPDNSQIAFQSDAAGNYDIYVTKQGVVTRLTYTSSYDGEMTWSPDGKQLAFVSDRSGSKNIWIMNADGSAPRQLTTYDTATTPAWSPLGDQIAYAADTNHDGFYEILAVRLDGSYSIPAREGPTDGRDHWSPVWSPDGKWLASIQTSWFKIKDRWYWYDSKLFFGSLFKENAYLLPGDDLIWKASWTTTDLTPPEPCKINGRPYQAWESFSVNWSAIDIPAGVSTYDVQVRNLPDGAWRDFLSNVAQPGGIYPGKNGQQYEFRCRARDGAQNVAGWETATASATKVETGRPFSQVSELPRYVKGNHVTVNWQGTAPAGGVSSYDIFTRDGEQGDWNVWLKGTTATTAEFSGTPGHTYYFRSQAHDQTGRAQVWQPEPQTMVTLYTGVLSLRVNDMRGNPLPAPNFTLVPPAVREEAGQAPFEKRWDVSSPVRIDTTVPGFGDIPDTTLSMGNEHDFVYVMPPADDQIINGGFEAATLHGWSVSNGEASVSNTIFHSGQSAVRLVPGPDGAGELVQATTVVGTLHQPTFSFLYHFADNPNNGELSADDIRPFAAIRIPSAGFKFRSVLNITGASFKLDDYWRGPTAQNEHDPSSGEVNWTLTFPIPEILSAFSITPVISGRTAFVTYNSVLMAIDLDTRSVRWSISDPYGNYHAYLPVVAGDMVYAINSGKLEARLKTTPTT